MTRATERAEMLGGGVARMPASLYRPETDEVVAASYYLDYGHSSVVGVYERVKAS